MTSLSQLVEEFADTVIGQKAALKVNNHRKGNRLAKARRQLWQQIRAHGDEGREALSTLLEDRRPDVRGMAAAYLLRYKTDEAKQVLQEVAEGEGIAAFGAAQALQRWEEGDWHLDPG